ncbi:MAG: pre-TMP frameshift protein [Phage AS32]|nr:MAG: pre-TMP frameshift protein [Phage AS32]
MQGGLFDQNPELLERFLYILQAQEEQRQKEENERKRKQGGPSGKKIRGSRPSY